MKTSEQIDAISKAFIKAQAELPNPLKDSTNPHYKNSYSSLAAVRTAYQPVLTKHGLAISHFEEPTPNGEVAVGTRLLHESGQWFETAICIKPDRAGAQAVGSCITYGRRYGVCAILGIVADEDDDGNEAVKPAASKTAKSAPQPKAAPPEPKATNDQIMAIEVLADETGADLEKMLGFFDVRALADLTSANANRCLAILKKKKTTTPEAAAV